MKSTLSKIPRWQRRLLITAVFATALFGLGVNLWLAFGGTSGVSTDKTKVRWSSAWMILPGRITVNDLRLSAQTPSDQWQLDVERTTARVSLLALLRRHFVLSWAHAEGAEFRLRRRLTEGDDLASISPHLPPIDGFELSHRQPRSAKKRPWRFSLRNLEFRRVERLWVDEIELRNPKLTGLVSGSADFIVRGPMALNQVRYALDSGELWLGGTRVANDLGLRAETSLRPTEPAQLRDPASFENLDGRVEVQGTALTLGFLGALLPERLHQLDLRGGGSLEARIHIDRGRFVEPSTLTVETTDLDARFGSFHGRGRGRIEAAVVRYDPAAEVASEDGPDAEDSDPAVHAPRQRPGPTAADEPTASDPTVVPVPAAPGEERQQRATITIRLDDVRVDADAEPRDAPGAESDDGATTQENGPATNEPVADATVERFQVEITGFDPRLGRPLVDPRILLELPSFEIPDLALFTDLVPSGLDLDILGGSAQVQARMSLSAESEQTDFEIVAEKARLRFRGTRIEGELRLAGSSVGGPREERETQVRDLSLQFAGGTRPSKTRARAAPVGFSLTFGPLDLQLPDRSEDRSGLRLINDAVEVRGRFDDLGWWNVKGKLSQGLHLRGRGTFKARLGLDHSGEKTRLGTQRELTLDIARFELPDLAEFSDLLPKSTGLELEGGRGVVRAHFELRNRRESLKFNVDASDVRITFRGTRIHGALNLGGRSIGNQKNERLALRDVALDFAGSTEPSKAESHPVRFRLELGDTDVLLPSARDGRKLRLASGVLELRGQVDDLGWWESPLPGEDWLKLQGKAVLRAKLRLRETSRGLTLGAPSEITADLPDLVAELGAWRAAARGEMRGRLDDSGSRLLLELDEPTLSRDDYPSLRLPTLRLEARGPELARGRKLDGVHVSLVAEPTRLRDLSILNAYLPEGKLQFNSGTGALEGRLDFTKDDATATFELHSGGAVAQVSGKTLSTRVDLELDLSSQETSSRRFKIDQGELHLRDVLFADVPNQTPDWWAVAEIRDGWVEATKPIALNARVELRLRDPQPIVHLVGEQRRTVTWLAKVLDIQDVHGTGRMILDDGGLRFEDLDIRGEDLRVRGHIDLEEPVRALLLIQYHQFFAGVEKVGDDRNIRLFRPQAWFEERSRAWLNRVRP